MKKLIASLMAVAVLVWVAGPLTAVGITTTLNQDQGAGSGSAPTIFAKWEMNAPYANLLGTDNDPAAGAQFKAPMTWDGTKPYSICSIVGDPDSLYNADIDGVYVDIYYPEVIAFHPAATSTKADKLNGGTDNVKDYGVNGCGQQRGDENRLNVLSVTNGYKLFCETIQNNNTNLPTFYNSSSYVALCAQDGELMKQTAYVYCANKELIWEDPAGAYKVKVLAQDKSGKSSTEINHFTYLAYTGFQVDFTSVNYGNVKLNTKQGISGDLNYGTADRPTVRNTGNTRLYMGVQQNDMGLGTTDGVYNVKYDGRVGNNSLDWKDYLPNTANPTYLEDILDLSETEEMDFSILVTKYPETKTTWTGLMTLSAKFANFRQCTE